MPALVLDVQALQNPDYRSRGIGRYVLEHTRALLRRPHRVAAVLMNPLRPAPSLPPDLATAPPLQWRSANPSITNGPVVYHLMSPFEMGSPVESLLPPPGLPAGTPNAVTLYDLIPLADPERNLPDRASTLRYRARLSLVRSADAILAISQYSADDAVARLGVHPGQVHVIGGGVAAGFAPSADPETARTHVRRALPALTRPFVLSVTGSHDRKNTEGLLAGYAQLPRALRDELQLVVACEAPPSWQDRWREHARALGLGDDEVVITGYVTDELLLLLYQTARLFVFPSFSEGFGLPVAEAIACGCPTITSNATSVPEILDWPESTFDPGSPEELATVAARALTDEEFRAALRRAGDAAAGRWTWDAVADRTLAAVDQLGQPPAAPSSTAPRRMRIALASPFDPVPSGVANYSGLLLDALAERCELDLLVEPGTDARELQDRARRVLPVSRLGVTADPSAYDAVVYAIGNSVFHHATHDAALRHPGILWLHDIRLQGLVTTWTRARFGERWSAELDRMIEAQYGPRVPSRDEWWALPDHELYGRLTAYDAYLTRHLVAGSRGVLLHSEGARRLFELDQPPGSVTPPAIVVPVTVPKRPARRHERRARPLVVSMGIVASVKDPETLIRAAALVEGPLDVALVGEVSDGYRADLERLAASVGLQGDLILPGSVSRREYWGWLDQAWGAVQLRRTWNGETSGAVNDSVASAVPVATNLPSAGEMIATGAATPLPMPVSPRDVAAWLTGLVTGTTVASQQDCQRRYTEAHTAGTVADAIVDAIRRLTAR